MSATRRPILNSKALTSGDPDTRDLLRQFADGFQRAIEIQDSDGGHVAILWNKTTRKIQVCEDGKTWTDI